MESGGDDAQRQRNQDKEERQNKSGDYSIVQSQTKTDKSDQNFNYQRYDKKTRSNK